MTDTKHLKHIFASNLKTHMMRTRKTQRDVARELNIPEMTLSNWMNAKTYPRIDKIKLLADYFKIQRSDLTEEEVHELDLSDAIREEREHQGLSINDLASEANINPKTLALYENGEIQINSFFIDSIMNVFEMSFAAFLDKYDLYDEYIPPEFNGDIERYENFKQAVELDALSTPIQAIDIQQHLLYAVNAIQQGQDVILFNGMSTEPMERNLMLSLLENTLRTIEDFMRSKQDNPERS